MREVPLTVAEPPRNRGSPPLLSLSDKCPLYPSASRHQHAIRLDPNHTYETVSLATPTCSCRLVSPRLGRGSLSALSRSFTARQTSALYDVGGRWRGLTSHPNTEV